MSDNYIEEIKKNILTRQEVKSFEILANEFFEKIGRRHACDKFAFYETDGRFGIEKGTLVTCRSSEKFYFTRTDLYDFYTFIKERM